MNTTKLIPTSQWIYALIRVTYHEAEGAPALLTKYFLSTDTHLEGDIKNDWPSSRYKWYNWEVVKENAGVPRVIGNVYNIPLYESALSAGEHVAEKLGLLR